MIKRCLKCGEIFLTKNERERFCCEECRIQFNDNIKRYTFDKEERYSIRKIKDHLY